jgi:thymidylate synthase
VVKVRNPNRFIKSETNRKPDPLVLYRDVRTPDDQYKQLLQVLQQEGCATESGMDDPSHNYVDGYTLRFDLTNGFPIITERDLTRGSTPEIIESYQSKPEYRPVAGSVRQALGEILAFINGARTQEKLEDYGCNGFWKPWTVGPEAERKAKKRGIETGDLGPGSYGAAFHDFPTAEGEKFNQYENLINQINFRPELKTHIITPFIPQYISRAPDRQQKVLIVPCHGFQHFHIDTNRSEISMTHVQRSADSPIGLPFNFIHYAAILMMVGQVTGYRPTKLTFFISDAHYYDRHLGKINELLARPAYPFPKLFIDPKVKNIFDFRTEHFTIQDYYAHPPINMEGTAI